MFLKFTFLCTYLMASDSSRFSRFLFLNARSLDRIESPSFSISSSKYAFFSSFSSSFLEYSSEKEYLFLMASLVAEEKFLCTFYFSSVNDSDFFLL